MSKIINLDLLQCPKCKSQQLLKQKCSIKCSVCLSEFKTERDKFFFSELELKNISDQLDRIKYVIKKYHRWYTLLIGLISPVCPTLVFKRFINKNVTSSKVCLNLGSGNSDLSGLISNIDIINYDNVDLVSDLSNLPFKNNSVDVIINIAVLEHVPNPEKVVNEFFRVLKRGGKILCFFPFMQGIHASPFDFSRRTEEGARLLFKEFDIHEVIPEGPTSGFLWVFQEWLAILLSFGSKKLYLFLYVVIMFITSPIKFLDVLLRYHPMAKNISTGFSVIAAKKGDS